MSDGEADTVLRLEGLRKEFPEPSGVLHVLKGCRSVCAAAKSSCSWGRRARERPRCCKSPAACSGRRKAGSRLRGRDYAQAPERERLQVRRKRLGFVFQNFHLVDALTAYDNVALAQRLRRQPIQRAADPGDCSTAWASPRKPRSSPGTSAAAKNSGLPLLAG